MSPLKKSNNIAARMGRWSASHWKTAVFGWLAFVVAAVVIGMAVGTKNIDQNDANVGQSHRADHILRDAGFQADPQTEIVLIQSKKLTVEDPAFRADDRRRRRRGQAVPDDQEPALAARRRPRRPDLGGRPHRAWSSWT